jgi:hypothetical protein
MLHNYKHTNLICNVISVRTYSTKMTWSSYPLQSTDTIMSIQSQGNKYTREISGSQGGEYEV